MKTRSPTQFARMAQVVRLLVNGERLSAAGAAERLDCHSDRTRGILRHIHEAALAHVVDWERHGAAGPYAPVYAWCAECPLDDAPRPKTKHTALLQMRAGVAA